MAMWMQLIKTHLKPGMEAELLGMMEELRAIEQSDSGLVRSTLARDQKDPNTVYTIVTFESEEKARAREADPRRQAALETLRARMAQIFDGPPEFLDLEVMTEYGNG